MSGGDDAESRVHSVEARIGAALKRSGRARESLVVVSVSKRKDPAAMNRLAEVLAQGMRREVARLEALA